MPQKKNLFKILYKSMKCQIKIKKKIQTQTHTHTQKIKNLR